MGKGLSRHRHKKAPSYNHDDIIKYLMRSSSFVLPSDSVCHFILREEDFEYGNDHIKPDLIFVYGRRNVDVSIDVLAVLFVEVKASRKSSDLYKGDKQMNKDINYVSRHKEIFIEQLKIKGLRQDLYESMLGILMVSAACVYVTNYQTLQKFYHDSPIKPYY